MIFLNQPKFCTMGRRTFLLRHVFFLGLPYHGEKLKFSYLAKTSRAIISVIIKVIITNGYTKLWLMVQSFKCIQYLRPPTYLEAARQPQRGCQLQNATPVTPVFTVCAFTAPRFAVVIERFRWIRDSTFRDKRRLMICINSSQSNSNLEATGASKNCKRFVSSKNT